jgi:hypothetical protein
MVGAADIIADHLRRVASDEDRTRIANVGHQGIRIIDRKFQMLGSDAVGERNGVGELFDQNDRAEIRPACRRGLGTRQALQLPLDGRFNGLAEFGIVGDQDRLRPAIMSMPTVPKTWRFAAAT